MSINIETPPRPSFRTTAWAIAAILGACAAAFGQTDPGPWFEAPTLIENAQIVSGGGEAPRQGYILIENGIITAVGAIGTIPEGADRIDARGLVVYPGFIDAHTQVGLKFEEPSADSRRRIEDESPDVRDGPQSATVEAYRRFVRPNVRAEELIDPSAEAIKDHREAGFTTAVLAPPSAVLAGRSAVAQLGDRPWRRQFLVTPFAQHASLSPPGRGGPGRGQRRGPPPAGESGYPGTKMGRLALFRQTLLDSAWYDDLTAWSARHPDQAGRMPLDTDLVALNEIRTGLLPVVLEANSENDIHRALNAAREFALRPIIVGGREAWKLKDRLQAEYVPVIVSLKWDDEPRKHEPPRPATQPADSTSPPLFGKEWQDRPFEPRRAVDERRRLWEEQVDNCLRLHEAGIPFALTTTECKSVSEFYKNLRKAIERGLPENAAVAALTSGAARILGMEGRVGTIQPGAIANLTILTKPLADKNAKVKLVFIDGRRYEYFPDGRAERRGDRDVRRGRGRPDSESAESRDEPDEEAEQPAPSDSQPASAPTTTTSSAPAGVEYPEWPVEIESDRRPAFKTGGNILLRNATLLTVTHGRMNGTDLLVKNGKIAAIGKDLPGDGAVVVDLTGYVVSPGIFDAHSHMAIDGGVNEGTLSVTSEVRIGDVINPRDVSLYRALAGGVTAIHTMHGSANTIGGECSTIKLRYGRTADEMKFVGAKRTLKWALGENVTQKHSGNNRGTRFPNSRMGVIATIRRSLDSARAYADERAAFQLAKRQGSDPRPPRRDLRLDALSDVLSGDLWVNCHCYRADEIAHLLMTASSYGFRIACLQHVLEGYRILPEILQHGAAASTFSDWWAYKIEAYDAVPHNAARMVQAGIVTTVNSDSAEVVRHLNVEAAKSIANGGLDETDALRLVTLNAAIQFGVDNRVGSLDVGKDADLAIWDGHPLDTFSRCVMTLIDGEAYFVHPQFDPASPPRPRNEVMTFAAPPDVPPVPTSESGIYALVGGTIHPVNGADIPNGTLVMQDSMITAIGPASEVTPPENATLIRIDGLHVYPGLMELSSGLGLREVTQTPETVDTSEIGRFQPDVCALWAVNPHSELIEVARAGGILTALAMPTGGAIPGQASFLNLRGWTPMEMSSDPGLALCVNLPSLPNDLPDEDRDKQIADHVREIREIERYFVRARQYAARQQVASLSGAAKPKHDARWEAMVPYLQGDLQTIFTANSYKQILEALEFARRVGVRPVINGGRDAWKLAGRLAAEKVPVIVRGSTQMPEQPFGTFDSGYRNAAILDAAGVTWCFGMTDPSNARQLGVEAGMAVAHGLPHDRAIRAITLGPAQVLGIDVLTGSLEQDRLANVIVTTGSPCQASTRVQYAFIEGKPVSLESRHTRNDARFRGRKLPLGVQPPPAKGPMPMWIRRSESDHKH